MWRTEEVPGVGNKFASLPEYVTDLTPEQIKALPTEARLSIKYLTGERYSRDEITAVIGEFIAPQCAGRKWEVCGSYRRKLLTCKDIDLLVLGSKIEFTGEIHTVRDGASRSKFIVYSPAIEKYVPIDVYYTTAKSWPYSLLHLTGSKEFNIRLRRAAIKKSMKLNEYILSGGAKLKTEREIIEYLLGKYVKPEDR
jgi:DNA polymerase/3'-5' exonuclease PolX